MRSTLGKTLFWGVVVVAVVERAARAKLAKSIEDGLVDKVSTAAGLPLNDLSVRMAAKKAGSAFVDSLSTLDVLRIGASAAVRSIPNL